MKGGRYEAGLFGAGNRNSPAGCFTGQVEAPIRCAPQEVQDWYRSRKLTDAAAKRFAFRSCCDGSDKVETQFRVDRATGDDKWYYKKDDQWLEVPPDVIWWDEHSPTGEAVLFAIDGRPTCFFPPRGGL